MSKRRRRANKVAPLKLTKADKALVRDILKIGEDGDTAAVLCDLKKLSLPARMAIAAASLETIRQTALDVLPILDKCAAKTAMLVTANKEKALRVCAEVKEYLTRRLAA